MEREIKIIGISKQPFEFRVPDGNVVPLDTYYYLYNSNNVEGNCTGKFSITAQKSEKYGLVLGGVYNAVFSYVNGKTKLEGLLEV